MNTPIPIRASRPALAPVPQLFPPTLDGLLAERRFASDRAARIDSEPLATRELAWAFRLNDRIARADKQ